jgi:hypothetical protein
LLSSLASNSKYVVEYDHWVWAAKNGFTELGLYLEDVSEKEKLSDQIRGVLAKTNGVKELLNNGVPVDVVSRVVSEVWQPRNKKDEESDEDTSSRETE